MGSNYLEARNDKCCICLSLSEGVSAVGVIGSLFHTGGIALLCRTDDHKYVIPYEELDAISDTLFNVVLLAIHSLGILVNLLLFIGAFNNYRYCLIPWLLYEGIISTFLLSLSLYYLILYPVIASTLLLWYSVAMVLCFLVIIYHVYIVQELLYKLWISELYQKSY
nr:uncharacterized protein LOC121129423 [Lepeophtheirus salmonis]